MQPAADTPTGPHPAHAAQVLAYWRLGRMEMQVNTTTCVCGQPHTQDTTATAVLEGAPPDWGAPPGTRVWRVDAQAPTAPAALRVARQVAKTLGYDMNPLLMNSGG